MREQPALARDSSAESGQRAIRSDHPMTRHHDRDGIAAVGEAHRARCLRITDTLSLLAVGTGFAIGYLQEVAPGTPLKFRAVETQRQVELAPLSLEVFLELAGGLPQRLRRRIEHPAVEIGRQLTGRIQVRTAHVDPDEILALALQDQ